MRKMVLLKKAMKCHYIYKKIDFNYIFPFIYKIYIQK